MAKVANAEGPPTPLGSSPPFLDMLAHVSRVAAIDRPVLVVGERGTGKELVAGRLTFLSPRWDRPFITINCAALAEPLLDSELFGHEAGAYTGAQRRRLSRFEMADGGTLFLDEIATASLAVQEKLLRVIEYGRFERVGGNETIATNVRLIGATNADLPALARDGRFRADLLDRLAFDVVPIPPLRARLDDVMLLATHFARRMTSELGRTVFPGFTPRAEAMLLGHDWPGNVRELRNVVERSVARAERPERLLDRIVLDPFAGTTNMGADGPATPPTLRNHVPTDGREPRDRTEAATPVASSRDPRGFLERTREFENDLLRDALEKSRFNQKQAAERLGLTYYQFRHHLRNHGLLPGQGARSD